MNDLTQEELTNLRWLVNQPTVGEWCTRDNAKRLLDMAERTVEAEVALRPYKMPDDTRTVTPNLDRLAELLGQSLEITDWWFLPAPQRECAEEVDIIYRQAWRDFAGPSGTRHTANYDSYQKAGLVAVWNAAVALAQIRAEAAEAKVAKLREACKYALEELEDTAQKGNVVYDATVIRRALEETR